MTQKIKQLNNHPSSVNLTENSSCGYEQEIPGDGIDLDLSNLKERVANYKQFMNRKYSVPEEELFNIIVFDIENVKALIQRNPSIKGLRIYLSKNTSSDEILDYELIVVPCSEKTDKNGNKYFEDILNTTDPDANLFITYCRRPPGCPDQGAILNK